MHLLRTVALWTRRTLPWNGSEHPWCLREHMHIPPNYPPQEHVAIVPPRGMVSKGSPCSEIALISWFLDERVWKTSPRDPFIWLFKEDRRWEAETIQLLAEAARTYFCVQRWTRLWVSGVNWSCLLREPREDWRNICEEVRWGRDCWENWRVHWRENQWN